MICWGVAAPHIGEVVDWRNFFLCFVGQAHSRPRPLEYHVLYINRRGSGQGCAFGGLIDTPHPMRSYLPNTHHFQDVSGDLQLKCLRAYLSTGETNHNA